MAGISGLGKYLPSDIALSPRTATRSMCRWHYQTLWNEEFWNWYWHLNCNMAFASHLTVNWHGFTVFHLFFPQLALFICEMPCKPTVISSSHIINCDNGNFTVVDNPFHGSYHRSIKCVSNTVIRINCEWVCCWLGYSKAQRHRLYSIALLYVIYNCIVLLHFILLDCQ